MPSATIKLFLPLGDAKSLRTAEISNWTGKAVAAPRTELEELLAREELEKAGVYILLGSDPLTNAARAYIGEAALRQFAAKQAQGTYWISPKMLSGGISPPPKGPSGRRDGGAFFPGHRPSASDALGWDLPARLGRRTGLKSPSGGAVPSPGIYARAGMSVAAELSELPPPLRGFWDFWVHAGPGAGKQRQHPGYMPLPLRGILA